MVTHDSGYLEAQIASWRSFMMSRMVDADHADELEDHLRSQIQDLSMRGLEEDEAFLIGVKRLGALDELSHEFAKEHAARLWKQLTFTDDPPRRSVRHALGVMLGFAIAAALAIKLPELFGVDLTSGDHAMFYAANVSLFCLPFLAAYFLLTRQARAVSWAGYAGAFVLAAAVANLFPFADGGDTFVLTALAVPVVLWAVVGVAYAGGRWRAASQRMDWIRFTGEWAIYYVLIALGGGVLSAISVAAFELIGMPMDELVGSWVIPGGAMGAVVVVAWLVDAKRNVIENMAPVLTRVFSPLFAIMLVALAVGVVVGTELIEVDREVLILFDLLLVVVFGLLLYAISARDASAKADVFDRIQLVLVGSAILVNLFGLASMLARISEFGVSPNKLAALGLNLALMVNLVGSARLLYRFITGAGTHAALERWQTSYLPVFLGWAVVVGAVFPVIFGFE